MNVRFKQFKAQTITLEFVQHNAEYQSCVQFSVHLVDSFRYVQGNYKAVL